jgi:cellulose synthase operon protein C
MNPFRILPWTRTLAVLATVLLVASCAKESPEAMVESARQYLAKNDRKAAVIQLKNALQKEPNRAEARYLLGRALVDNHEFAAAEKELGRARELRHPAEDVDPALAHAMSALGKHKEVIEQFSQSKARTPATRAELDTAVATSLAATGKIEDARLIYAAALAAQPGYAPALLGSARIAAASGDVDGALKLAESASVAAPGTVEAWLMQGDLLLAKGQQEPAVAAFRKAVAAAPGNVQAHTALVMTLVQQNNNEGAAEALAQFRKVAPKAAQVAYLDGLVKYRQGDNQGARVALQEFLRLAPDNLPGLLLAGANEYKLRSYGTAEAYLSRVLSRAPNHAYTRRLLVATYVQNGQTGKALETLTPVLAKVDKDPVMLGVAGEVYLLNGDAAEATKYFAKAAALDPSDEKRRTALALSHVAAGDSERGMRELEEASASENAPRATMALILSMLQRGQYDKALAEITALERRLPDKALPQSLRGLAYLGKRDFGAARTSFERALQIDPAFVPAVLELARLDVVMQKPDDARKRLEAFTQANPKSVRVLVALAELRARSGASNDEVAGILTKAVAADPADPTPRIALVQQYLRAKDTAKALTVAQEAVNAFPGRPQALEALAHAQEASGNTNQALTTYNRLAEAQPGSPGPYVAMADVQIKARDFEGAMQSLRKALTIKPDYVAAQRGLVALHTQAGRTQQAVAVARDVQKQRPKESIGYMLEGDTHSYKRNWNEAAAAYRNGLKMAGTTDLASKLHATLMASAQRAEAEKVAASWLKDHPDDSVFRMYLAQESLSRKDYGSAIKDYEAMLKKRPNDPVILNNFAWAAGKANDPRAIEAAEKANSLAPNQPAIMDTLGSLLVERGDTARGVELLQKASTLAPQSANIRFNLAKALAKSGQKDAARKELEELSKLGSRYAGQEEVAQLMKTL